MARTIELSGASQRDFVRALMAGEGDVSDDLAQRLAEAMGRHVRRMHVLKASHRRLRQLPRRILAIDRDGKVRVEEALAIVAARAPEPEAAAPFDPYAFAVEAMLIKHGREALAARLADIAAPGDLRALAKAQRINLDASVSGNTAASPEALRAAIIAGAERRIADRRAAAG
jgi:hypothetical protein